MSAKKYILYSDTPAPFPGGDRNDYFPGAPGNPTQPTPGFGPNTRTLMRFDVSLPLSSSDPTLLIDQTTDLTGGLDLFLVPISNIQAGTWSQLFPQALPFGT